jgi:DNA-binding CsgD family transcriptional regulator
MERLLGTELVVVGGRLAPADPAFRSVVERTVGTALGLCGVVSLPLPVALPKASGRALVLHALPLSGEAALLFAPARALILVRDLDETAVPLEAHLRSVFGLTKAEARIALEVATGEGLKPVAERLGISMNTAHTQLRAVFEKTGTSRQAELVRVLSRLAALV